MSREVDERIVSMQFENRNFEKNANQSMSTLDKLKEKLNFKAAAKGVDNLDAAVKKVDFSSMSKSVDNVGLRFNAMFTIADQTFRNIINSAENAAKRMVSAFTIDPVKTGLSEYETKINAIQVIQSNTRGVNTMDEITSALDELNTYADKTIYNFAQMTSNIGKFVAQGLDVQKATNAVQGMANLAAASGASPEDMARATYQMSQALGGVIRKIDWNSLRNANMATVDLKNTLMDLARVEGIDIDGMISDKGTFEDTLEKGWLTGDMFTEAMNIYSGVYDEVTLKSKGFSDEQIKNFMDLAKSAESAATEVKTFSQLMDVLKETAQSGWTQTWEEVIGDFESAKKTLTQVQVYFSNIIDAMSDARNFVVKNALNFAEPWTKLMEKLNGADLGISKVKDIIDTVSDYTDKLEYFQDVLHNVWMGNYKNADTGRYGLLDNAGYDHRVVQELVNISDEHYKSQGWKYQLTVDDIRAAHEKYGLTLDENTVSIEQTEKATTDLASALEVLSDDQLEQAGLTKDEIKILRELQKESKRTGRSIEDIGKEMSTTTGRMLMIDSLKNVWSGLLGVFTAVSNAWKEIFPPMGFVQLYNAIKAVNKFSENLRLTDKDTGELTDTAEKLQRIFKGIFAIFKIVTTFVGSGFKIAFKAVGALLNLFGTDILTVAACIGDAAVAFSNWITSLMDFEKIFKGIGKFFKNSYKVIKDWIKGLKETDNIPQYIIDSLVNGFNKGASAVSTSIVNLGKKAIAKLEEIFGVDFSAIFAKVTPVITKVINKFKEWFGVLKDSKAFGNISKIFSGLGTSLNDWIAGFKDIKGTKNIAKYIVSGLINGLKEGIKTAASTMLELAKSLLTTIKDFLGIHSPSTVFFAIGGFIIAGLIGGILAGGTDVWNTIKEIGQGCIEALKDVDWGALLAVATIAGFLLIANKLANAFKALVSPMKNVNLVLKNFAGIEKSVKNFVNAQSMKAIAISIAIIAGSIVVLSLLDVGKAWSAVGMIAVIIGLLIGSLVAIDKLGKDGEKTVSQFILVVAAIGGAILLLAISATMMSKINADGFANIFKIILAYALLITLFVMITKIATNKEMDQLGKTLLSMAGAMAILAIAAKILSSMNETQIESGIGAIYALTLVIFALTGITKIATNKELELLGKTLLSMAGCMAILALVMKMLGGMSSEEMKVALVGIAALVSVILFLTIITQIASEKEMNTLGKTLLSMAGAIAILAIIAIILGKVDPNTFKTGMLAMIQLTLLIALLISITWLTSEKEMNTLGKTIFAMAGAIAILAIITVILGLVKPETLKQGLTAIILLSLCMAILVASTRGATDCMKNLIVLAVAIAILGGILIALSCMDPIGVAVGTVAMMALMGMFALLIKMSGKSSGSLGVLITLTVAVGLLGGILIALSCLPWQNTLVAAVSLSALMLAMIGVLFILEKMNVNVGKALKGIIALSALAIPLRLFVWVLSAMSGVENAFKNVIALSALALAMTILLIPLTLIGNYVTQALLGVVALTAMALPLLAFVGILALMQGVENATTSVLALVTMATALTLLLIPLSIIGALIAASGGTMLLGVVALTLMAIPMLAFVGVLALMQNIEGATTNVMLMVTLMTVMTDCLFKISLVAPLAVIAVVAIAALTLVITAFGVLAVAIGALVTEFPQLGTFLETGIPLMVKMAEGLGLMIGKFITALAGEVMTLLPQLGMSLSMFMINATPFILGAKMVDEQVLTGVGILAAAVLALTVADVINGIASFFTGGFAELGTELSMFMMNAMPFIMGAKLLNADMMTSVKALAETVLILTAADVINGLTSWFTGGSSLSEFGNELAPLGKSLNEFVTNLGTFTPEQVATVTCACDAVKALAEAAKTIPNEGGWAGKIFGENGIGAFASQLPGVGTAISGFIMNLGTFDDTSLNTVSVACDAIKKLSEAASEIPNEGGWAAKIFGDNGIGAFATQLPGVGTSISGFITNLGTFDDTSLNTVGVACDAIKKLSEAAKSIPNEGGWAAKIFGDNSLATFGEKLPDFANNLKKFIKNLGTFGEESRLTVSTAVGVIRSLATLAGTDMKSASKNIPKFSDKLGDLGSKLSDFVGKVTEKSSETYNSAVNNVKAIVTVVKSINKGDADAMKDFADNLKKLGEKAVDKFVNGFTGKSTESKITSSVTTLVNKFTSALEKKISSFEEAGKDFGDGLITGINAKKTEVYNAGFALGQKAVEGEKAGQQSNSPSKLTYKAGKWIGEGLVNGMVKMTSAVYGAGYNLGETATGTISSAVQRISSALNSDIDSQPTITPVLDLSNVTAGANAISGLFSGRRTLTVDTGFVGAAASSMTNRQNGMDTSDIVSSIKLLRKDLANMPRESININGITYDDGSNIADAVQTLVRAAKIERRV